MRTFFCSLCIHRLKISRPLRRETRSDEFAGVRVLIGSLFLHFASPALTVIHQRRVPMTVEPLPSRIFRRVISFALIHSACRVGLLERTNARFREQRCAQCCYSAISWHFLSFWQFARFDLWGEQMSSKYKFLLIFTDSFTISELNS